MILGNKKFINKIKLILKGITIMSETKKYVMTYEGVKKLEEELEYLKTVKRKEITEKIKVALGYGDLSENSEYDEAKNDQAFTEGRILQIRKYVKECRSCRWSWNSKRYCISRVQLLKLKIMILMKKLNIQ